MKGLAFCLATALLGMFHADQRAASDSSTVLARYHFAGPRPILKSTNATALKKIWTFPSSAGLRDDVVEKVSAYIEKSFVPQQDQPETSIPQLIKPLLTDLLQVESYAEFSRSPKDELDWIIAVRLPENKIQLWLDHLDQLASQWKPRNRSGTAWLATKQFNDLVVFASRKELIHQHARILRDFQQKNWTGLEEEPWLQAELDLEKIESILTLPKQYHWPRAELALSGQGGGLRTEARFLFPEQQNWKLESWNIPDDLIRDPEDSLVSFTAIQSLQPWLENRALPPAFQNIPKPNQLFFWGHYPLQLFAAIPVPNASNRLEEFTNKTLATANESLSNLNLGKIRALTNEARILWQGLPLIMPFLKATQDNQRDFLLAGTLPVALGDTPAPAELFAQVQNRTNLLLYDWEVTQPRLLQLRPLSQIYAMILGKPGLGTNAPSGFWLENIVPSLGNTVTEVIAHSPTELRLVRRSDIGFTALELIALTRWIASTNFPEINLPRTFQIQPRPKPVTP